MNEQPLWKRHFPFALSTLLIILSIYLFTRVWLKVFVLIVSQIRNEAVLYGTELFGTDTSVSILTLIFGSIFVVFSWLLSTRIAFYQKKFMRVVVFLIAVLTVWGGLAAYGMNQVKQKVIPYFEERLVNVIETDGFFESIVFEQTDGFYLMVLLIPMLTQFFITLFLMSKYVQFEKALKEPFFAYEWTGKWLQKLSKMEKKEVWPDLELGENSQSREMVVLPGRDRTLNTMIIGSIGTGKTAALGLPMINQDLHHMTRYINEYPEIYQREDFLTEEVGGRYLSGISIIEPSNDLCQKSLELVKAHGIPDEAITYINPLDPNTPNINPMRGPVDKVAEVFAQVIAGLNDSKDGGNFFFEQAQRNHLKHYIYLLKLHDPDDEVTLDMLLDMYNNPQVVRKMHEKLKRLMPSDADSFEDRDKRNYWKIVQGIDEWFDLNLLPKETRHGNATVKERNPQGEIVYYDAKAEHVQGLRNILNDIGANPLIRRVLFGRSDFDFDTHMMVGGCLLVNTAKGELVNLGRVLGKIVLMNLQNASFRRPPIVSSFHHILIDEAPDYLYNAFREFPAQSRKYKVIITTLKQTIAQLADQFGEHYMTTLIGTMRNRMVYGDVPSFDAKYFSEMFGEKFVYDEGQTEMSVSPLQEDPMSRSGSQYQKVREQAMTSGDIMFQDAFQCAVKIVSHNKPMPVTQIQAKFVPKEEFSESVVRVNEESLKMWLKERRRFLENMDVSDFVGATAKEEVKSVEETEEENASHYVSEKQNAFSLDIATIEKAVSVFTDPRPREPLNYNPEMVPATPIHRIRAKQKTISVETVDPVKNEGDENVTVDWTDSINCQTIHENSWSSTEEEKIDNVNNTVGPNNPKSTYKPSKITKEQELFADDLIEDFDKE